MLFNTDEDHITEMFKFRAQLYQQVIKNNHVPLPLATSTCKLTQLFLSILLHNFIDFINGKSCD